MVVTFDLPDDACRRDILHQYAVQLGEEDIAQLVRRT